MLRSLRINMKTMKKLEIGKMSVSEGTTAPIPATEKETNNRGNVLTELVALKRSAHHAFIEWPCGGKEHPTLFVNNVYPSNPPRFG